MLIEEVKKAGNYFRAMIVCNNEELQLMLEKEAEDNEKHKI